MAERPFQPASPDDPAAPLERAEGAALRDPVEQRRDQDDQGEGAGPQHRGAMGEVRRRFMQGVVRGGSDRLGIGGDRSE